MNQSIFVIIAMTTMSVVFDVASLQAVSSSLDKDNTLMVNGKRFFPIGIYYIPKSQEPFKELAEAGFNLVRCDSQDQLDKAHEYNLKVWVSLGDRLDLSKGTKENEQYIRSKVAEFKPHPALFAWESMDEPAWTWKKPSEARASAEGLAQGHKLVKELDPEHLLWINHAPRNTTTTLAKFSQNTDILACDVYPVISKDIDTDKTYAIMPNGKQTDLANQTISCVGEYVDKMKKSAGDIRATWIVLQGFAWDDKLFPTYEETKFMAYNAIIHGVKGILYWGTHAMPQPSDLWTDLKRVIHELGDFSPVLASPDVTCALSLEYEEMGFSIDSGVEYLVKDYEGVKYMITANTTIGPTKVTFSDIPFPAKVAEVMFENRTCEISNNSFMDSFKPYEVHIYRIK
ncbi:MAG: hypothetical protein QG588_1816 [Candidatus Poribacteria bacterium]|nr:hypothetical protein [Candidatus Poribacteria bacterium]